MMKKIIIFLLMGLFVFTLSCGNNGSVDDENPGVDGQTDNGSGQDDTGEETGDSQEGTNRSMITQYGITWYFDQAYETGQFVNGDYWVIGPVEITHIDPPSTEIDGRIKNGSMLNPDPNIGNKGYDPIAQGYDNQMWATDPHYAPDLNVGLDLSESNPLVLQPGSSLVSSISVDEANSRPQLQSAAVLTVLDTAPPEGCFRPPYAGSDKSINYNTSTVASNLSLLSSLNTSGISSIPAVETASQWCNRPWLDHIPGYLGARIHPVDNMPEYGGNLASRVGEIALWLHLDFTMEEKMEVLIGFVQVGIDLFAIAQNGYIDSEGNMAQWVNNGGHGAGRKWPILFAGIMLDDSNMIDIVSEPGVFFQEDQQTFAVTQDSVDYSGYTDRCGSDQDLPCGGYTQAMIGMPEWGIIHGTSWFRDTALWETAYRGCCTATNWSGFILSAVIMDAVDEWDHDVIFDYMDRYIQYQNTYNDGSLAFSRGWIRDVWAAYRSAFNSEWEIKDWSTFNAEVNEY